MKSVCCRVCLLAILALCVLPPAVSWGQLGGQFEYPFSVAVDRMGNFYVSERDRHRINKLDPQGAVIWRSGTRGAGNDQFYYPAGIAVDSVGSIYVADTFNARVQKLNSNGASIGRWGSYGSGPGQFRRPRAIAIDSSDNVYVLDSELRRVQKFSNDGGAYYGAWGTVGTGDGQFTPLGGGPGDIVIDPSGNAYITDTSAYRIHKWEIVSNPAGDIQRAVFLGWSGRCTSGANCDVANGRSRGFTCTAATCSAASPGDQAGQFTNPLGLALDSQGSLFVADFDNNRVQKLGNTGSFLTMWGSLGTLPQEFRGPIDVAAQDTAAVYVADMRNKRVLKFTNAGAPVASFGGDIFLSAFPGYPPAVRDALVDPNPLFVMAGQTKTSTLRVDAVAFFQGPVALTQSCCGDLVAGGGPVVSLGVTLDISPTSVDVPSTSFVEATIRLTANATPTPGKFFAIINGENQQKAVARQMSLAFEPIPVRSDNTAAPCPGFYQRGTLPEVLPLRSVLLAVFAEKAAAPSRTRFSIAVASTIDRQTGWQLDIDKATGLSPPLRANETLVVVNNMSRSDKGAYAISSPSCPAAAINAVVVEPNQTATMRISSADTTTLVLSRANRDLAVFSEPNFWTFFGGRRLTIICIGQ